MEVSLLKQAIENELRNIAFVKSVNISGNEEKIEGKAVFSFTCFLNIRYNLTAFTLSFSLISDNTRIWAIDRDNRFGWHRHPLYNVQVHETIDEMTVQEIITELSSVLQSVL